MYNAVNVADGTYKPFDLQITMDVQNRRVNNNTTIERVSASQQPNDVPFLLSI